jgi:hypothetical protein
MGKVKILLLFLHLLCLKSIAQAKHAVAKTTLVKIRVVEQDTRKITPVMICISNVRNSQVRVPPDGAVAGPATELELFYSGVPYSPDKNWVGPVRLTNGKGNNENRSSLYELKPSLPHWKEPVMYQTSGDFSIKLPPGTWRIAIEHGTEYIPVTEHIAIQNGVKEISKMYLLKRWINLPQRGWWSGDVHVHHPTNKPEYKEYLLQFAKAEDVHVVNMLEMGHHLGTDFKVAGFGKAFRTCRGDFCLVSGQEDPRTDYGHIIGLNIESQVRDTSVYNYYDLVFEKLRLQPGALIGYAHFSWNGFERGFPWHITSNEIDFVELLQFLRLNTPDYYDFLNLGFKITAAAGSDFPWASTIGDVRTFVYTGPEFSPDAWFAGLKAGATFVTNGPALFFEADGKMPGSVLQKNGASTLVLNVKALSNNGIGIINRVALYNNDGLVTEKLNIGKKDSVSISLLHAVTKSQWLAAVVYCDNGAVAHTTPVYVVVDGKPTYSKAKAPQIIQKQLAFIQKIRNQEKEKGIVDNGILERLDKADVFYQKLLAEVSTAN